MRYYEQPYVRIYRLSVEGPQYELGRNFRLIEAASKDGADIVPVSPALLDLLQKLRDETGAPLHINSWYRSPEHNKRIGGAQDSKHVRGLAADVVSRVWTPDEVAAWAERLDVGGVGRYRTFTHIDVAGQGRRWKG